MEPERRRRGQGEHRAASLSDNGPLGDGSVKRYVLHRVALAVPTLFLVSVIVFAMMRLMPGDVATRMVGLGVPPPYPTWGGMLSLAGLDHMYQAPWLAIWPAVALSLAVFGFNMLGDALSDLLDPRLEGG
ncbi:MAG: hypothetical protein DME05_04445 [Candidatus Rokuibacteriota bacterium]|nr:MAG: hypothetical protein DME05_04445 [Candidatus Rokubacteria bacterium]PYN76752.1 MAG: hypothetical protein DMD97_11000 [Candidatus Rokubacteria bacterium]